MNRERLTSPRRLRRAVSSTFHSFVFATAPALAFLVANMRQLAVSPSEGARTIIWLITCNIVLLAVIAPLRGLNAGAVTLSSFYIIVSFYTVGYGVAAALAPGISETMLAGVYVVGAAAAAVRIGRPPRTADRRYHTLNVAAATLLGVCAIMLALESHAWARRRWTSVTSKLVGEGPVQIRIPSEPPDIYYIVLDGFGRADVLRERYGVDLAPSLERLRELGWAIPARSRTNYSQTYLSLAAALNGTYLDPVAAVMRNSRDRRALHDVIQRSGPILALKQGGYRFRMLGSNTSVTRTHLLADDRGSRSEGLNEFENGLLTITPWRVLPLYGPTYGAHYHSVVNAFDRIGQTVANGRPEIVLAHLILPHPPFVVDEDGEPIVQRGPLVFGDGDHFGGTDEQYRAGYAKQVRYAMRRLVQFAERIHARRGRAIVVVHGDHGPGAAYSHRSLAEVDVFERFPIFMGLRLGTPGAPVPDNLSPVNVFRVIFNARFGGAFELLPNRSYYSPWDAPYRLTEIPLR
jgi:hypothetical protein